MEVSTPSTRLIWIAGQEAKLISKILIRIKSYSQLQTEGSNAMDLGCKPIIFAPNRHR
jgi:hypothetical protein